MMIFKSDRSGVSVIMKRKIFFWTICLILLMMTRSFGETSATCSDSPDDQTLPFTLTISGGVSLGSYEAGVNWALIDYMRKVRDNNLWPGKKPELKAVSGASAGAINAVLTAMLWLVDKREESVLKAQKLQGDDAVNDNIIRNTWVDVGIDQLLPKRADLYCNSAGTCPVGLEKPKAGDSYCEPSGISSPGLDKTGYDGLYCRPTGTLVDELFARHAFEEPIGKIRELLDKPVFMKNKCIDIALLATREKPTAIEKYSISVKNQRYVFLLQFVTDGNGRGHFKSKLVNNIDPAMGTVAYLPQKQEDGGQVEWNDVIRLLYASSAFPVAFGKVGLWYCSSDQENVRSAENICPDGTNLASADFIDGGVFDNIPLGAALMLRKARVKDRIGSNASDQKVKNEVASNYFFFISPSNRRNVTQAFKDPIFKEPRTFGLSGILGFLPGYIDAAADHELYTLLRSGDWTSYDEPKENKYRLVVTDRYFPITGAYLGHFGAFLDSPFREFDYSVGVYDAVIDLAEFASEINAPDSADKRRAYNELGLNENAHASVRKQVHKLTDGDAAYEIYKKLGLDQKIGQTNVAADVFGLIASQEMDTRPTVSWFWTRSKLPESDKQNTMYTIFKSVIETSQVPLADDDGDKIFGTFIKRLHENTYNGEGEEMKWIMKNYDFDSTVWYAPLVARAGQRLQTLQKLEAKEDPTKGMKFLVGTTSLALDRYFDSHQSRICDGTWCPGPWIFLPNTVPENQKFPYNLIPYELGFDMRNGGSSISYLVRIEPHWAKTLSLDFKATPYGYYNLMKSRFSYSEMDLYLTKHWRSWGGFSAGVGPTVDYLWQNVSGYDDVNVGAAFFVEYFHTLRLTLGVKSVEKRPLFGDNYYWTVGIVDLPGIFSRILE